MKTIELADWTVECRRAPLVRIGVVLQEDQVTELRIDVPSNAYAATSDARPRTAEPLGTGGVVARLTASGVELLAGGKSLGVTGVWRIVSPPADGAAMPPCLVVREVVAGRGFHWQKRIDQTLPGSMEIRQLEGHLTVVSEVSIETYLQGVVTAEMSGQCPLDLLKAQCVTARSWLLARAERKHDRHGFDFCNDDCCQRYQGLGNLTDSARRAVEETTGEVMLYRDRTVIDANYSKNCGGIVEAPGPVWGVPKKGQYAVPDGPPDSYVRRLFPITPSNLDEYLTGTWLRTCDVFCSPEVVPEKDLPKYLGAVDDGRGYFRWVVEYSREQLEAILQAKHLDRVGLVGADAMGWLDDLKVARRGLSGRAIAMNVSYHDRGGRDRVATLEDQYWIRHALHHKFLYSSAFRVELDRDERGLIERVRFVGAGWGHGAGLCQIGALGMAISGYDYRAILCHYFEGITIESVYAD